MSEIWEEVAALWRAEGTSEEDIAFEADRRTNDPVAYDCWLALLYLDRPDVLEAAVSNGTLNPNALTPRGHTLLFSAMNQGRLQSLRILLQAGADPSYLPGIEELPNVPTKDYLYWAAFGDCDPSVVEQMLVACERVGITPTQEILEVARRKARPATLQLFERWVAGDRSPYVAVETLNAPLGPGDSVLVKTTNTPGTIEAAIDGTSRFWILVSAFGRSMRIQVEGNELERR